MRFATIIWSTRDLCAHFCSSLLVVAVASMMVDGQPTISSGDVFKLDVNTTDLPSSENTALSTETLGNMSIISSSTLSPNTSSNGTTEKVAISEEFRRKYLQELQAQTTLIMIPAMVWVLLLAVTGVIGNSLVLYVYSSQFVLNGTRVFILNIAAFDLITNLIIIPGEVYDMFHIWEFNQPWLCRMRLYVNAMTTLVSAQLLTALAFARYRKVCVPFGWQITGPRAKITAVVIILVMVVCAIPYAIINGGYTRETPHPEIFGHECTVDDSYRDTIWPLLNSALFIFLYLANSTVVVVLYSMVGVKAWRHSRTIGQGVSSNAGASNLTSDNVIVTNSTSMGSAETNPAPGTSSSSTENTKQNAHVKISTSQRTVTFSKKQCSRNRAAPSGSDKDRKKDQCGIEYFPDDDMNGNSAHNTRVTRSPMKPQGDVNLSMVRELTIKLRAVQKQNSREEEKREDVEDLTSSDEQLVSQDTAKDGTKTVQFKNTEPLKMAGVNGEEVSRHEKVQVGGTGEASGNIQTEGSQNTVIEPSEGNGLREEGRSTGDTTNNNKTGGKSTKSSELEPGVEIGNIPNTNTESDKVEKSEEPMSEFAKAMQWVDITYCLKDAETKQGEARAQEDAEKLSKSNSVSYSRKVSRDNSFLRKHRKLRENLTDTLSRSRKSKLLRKSSSVTALKDLPKKDEKTNLSKSNVNDGGIKPKRSLNRTTIMLIIISAVYIIGFIPYLALVVYYKLNSEEYKALDTVGLALYNLFLRSYLLNSASNAVIYGICDLTFRAKCVSVIRKKLRCVKS